MEMMTQFCDSVVCISTHPPKANTSISIWIIRCFCSRRYLQNTFSSYLRFKGWVRKDKDSRNSSCVAYWWKDGNWGQTWGGDGSGNIIIIIIVYFVVQSNTDLSKVLKLLSFAKNEVIWLRFNCYSEYDAAVEAFLFFFSDGLSACA